MLEKQKGVLVDVLKQLTVNLLKGLTISHISLPVKIFEPVSTLQRIVDLFSFAPTYLKRAAELSDPVERMKLVITNAISAAYLCSKQMKPFNPILGETLQGEFPDGTEVYCEHTSHHPPIANFHFHPKDKAYEFWGYHEITAQMHANSMQAGQKGPNYIKFHDGQLIRYCNADYKIHGTVMGERTIEVVGNMVFEDLTNNIKAVLAFNTYKKTGYWHVTESGRKDEVMGVIYRTAKPIDPKASYKAHYVKGAKEIKDLSSLNKDMEEKFATVSGSWLHQLYINEELFWDIDNDHPMRQKPMMEES